MERNKLIKRLKGVVAMMLTALLLLGNPLTAQAAFINDIGTLQVGDALNEGDIIFADGTGGIEEAYVDGQKISKNDGIYYYKEDLPEDTYHGYSTYFHVPSGTTLYLSRKDSIYTYDWILYFTTSCETTESQKSAESTTGHSHSYEWVTTLEPTATTNGICEYRCECGSVAASQPIAHWSFFVNKILSDIKNAPQNGTVTINYEGLQCLSKKMIETLLSRPDVTLVVQFKDKEATHQFTIPAGKAPTDGADWYGYYYLGALYGWQ